MVYFNNFMWQIQYEHIGSIRHFLILYVFKGLKKNVTLWEMDGIFEI